MIVVAGSLAQRPGNGGHTWALLQYVLGFRRLGWDVLFIDRLEQEMCHDEAGRACSLESSVNLSYFLDVVERFGLDENVALLYDGHRSSVGPPRSELLARIGASALVLNVMGFLTDVELLDAAPLRVFLDIDPGFGQMWTMLGLADLFGGHDRHVTIAENIGQPSCTVPTCGLEWLVTRQPVVLDHWPVLVRSGESFTSVASWRGPYDPVEYEGTTYGLRAHEFRTFAELPRLTGVPLEVALEIDQADASDLDLLERNGWKLVNPRVVAGDPDAYRRYITGSLAEFSVAKNMYVQSNSGWFSDRSICYLASGRPVVTQETGFSEHYSTGEGLLAFRTVDEARSALEDVQSDWPRHSRAARKLAEDYFDSTVVLTRLLTRLGVA
jgi:hypothetical protein